MQSTSQSHSCFRCQEKYQYHLTEIFTEISVQMVSARHLCSRPPKNKKKSEISHFHVVVVQ